METLVNGSFTSPLANANLRLPTTPNDHGLLAAVYNGISIWNIAFTLILGLVAYDQCMPVFNPTVTDRRKELTQVQLTTYGSIVGPAVKIPFIGPFFESVYPDFEKYKAKWASGELSCVSVFHKYGLSSILYDGSVLTPSS